MNAQPVPGWLEAQVDAALGDTVEVIGAELWVRFICERAQVRGRLVPWTFLRDEAARHGIERGHLDAALRNLHAESIRVGQVDVVDLPLKETPA